MDNRRLNQLMNLHSQDEQDEFILYALAQEYLKLEQYDQSLVYFDKLKQQNPDYVGLYYHLGGLQKALGDEDKALLTYNDGIEIAKKLGDRHAQSELQNALTNLELGID